MAHRAAAAALPLFKRAIEIDPKFAMAYAYLGRVYGDIGESDLAAESTSKAYQLRDRASDPERFFITASYDLQVTGNLEKAQQTCELWAQTYPREAEAPRIPGGDGLPGLRQIRKGGRRSRENAIELDPDFAFGYAILPSTIITLTAWRKPRTPSASLRAQTGNPRSSVQRYDIAFLRGDQAGMEREVALGQGNSELEDWIVQPRGFCPGIFRSLATGPEDVAACGGSGPADGPAGKRRLCSKAGAATVGSPFRECARGKARVRWRRWSFPRTGMWSMAPPLRWPSPGILPGAQTLADDLEKRFPEDTSVRFSYLPALRALLALNRGEPSKAIELLANRRSL